MIEVIIWEISDWSHQSGFQLYLAVRGVAKSPPPTYGNSMLILPGDLKSFISCIGIRSADVNECKHELHFVMDLDLAPAGYAQKYKAGEIGRFFNPAREYLGRQ
jgi:hypothetical protein